MNYIGIVIIFCALSGVFGNESTLPEDYKKCTWGSADFRDCFKSSLTTLLRYVINGIPAFDIPTLDPAKVENALLKPAKNSPVNMQILFYNITYSGMKDLIVTSVDGTDLKNYILQFEIFVPHTTTVSMYKMDGKFLLFNLHGSGDCVCKIHNFKLKLKWTGTSAVRDGKKHMEIKSTEMDTIVSGGTATFNNLFPGKPALDKEVNKAFNENFVMLFKEFKPALNSIMTELVDTNIKKFINNVPLDDLFIM